MRSAIVFSSWDWNTFNVPERVALALAQRGYRVLYCEMPVSRFRRAGSTLRKVYRDVYAFGPTYLGERLNRFPILRKRQWDFVARQITKNARELDMPNPIFLFSHVEGIGPLCRKMRLEGCQIVHICMDYPEPYQYELIDFSDRTLVIPKSVFHKLRARYAEKIHLIPQSVLIPRTEDDNQDFHPGPALSAQIPSPRLGYLGPIYSRVNIPLLRRVLTEHPHWHFICFGDTSELELPNVHGIPWSRPEDLPRHLKSFDVGIMPYDCFEEKNLHCVPLKLFDYFLMGLPVVSTPVLSLSEYSDLVYLADTAEGFAAAIESAMTEPTDSPERTRRKCVAREHSTEFLGERLEVALAFAE